ncbi:hypothetical protein PoB_004475000 [Plakobranchus ocellatus]|uniref:Uncharacterized protein n=1 Tax=Plakobranchus ocellatus TaxID=259542 RepID=A0AAV4BFC5_9GAST|nr:hypothetical protein PoB_004475000 [Plakobranchus ocellatus]
MFFSFFLSCAAALPRPDKLERLREEARLARACQARVLPEAESVQATFGDTAFAKVTVSNVLAAQALTLLVVMPRSTTVTPNQNYLWFYSRMLSNLPVH